MANLFFGELWSNPLYLLWSFSDKSIAEILPVELPVCVLQLPSPHFRGELIYTYVYALQILAEAENSIPKQETRLKL